MKVMSAIGAVIAAATIGVGSAAAAAAEPTGVAFGSTQQVGDADAVAGYTVVDLRPRGIDELSVPLRGEVPLSGDLWEAPTTVTAMRGPVIPAMQFFTARTPDGDTYRVIEEALAPDAGVSPLDDSTLSQGSLYFDVTGAPPTEVVYDDGSHDPLIWTE